MEDEVTGLLDEDAFNAAFDSYAEGGEQSTEAPPEEKPADEKPADEKPADEKPADEKPTPVEPPASATSAADFAKAVVDAVKTLNKPETPAPAAPVEEVDPPEVVEALKELSENWGTHKVAIEALLGKQEKKLRSEFEEILKPLMAQVAPVVATQQSMAQAEFTKELLAAHSDAYTILPDVEKWIEAQPKFMQDGYNKVLDEGSAADVAEFLTTYKTATGTAAPAPDPKADEAKAAAAKAAQDKLDKMETPIARRTSVTAEPDPEDYDSAFEASIKALSA